MRKRKGVSQQQEHVNGINANQRSDEVKYGSRTCWGMQRGAHVCQRVNKVEMQTNLMGYAEGCACLSEERQSEIRQTNLMGRAEECACLSEERRSEIRQTDRTGHAEKHACLSEKQQSEIRQTDWMGHAEGRNEVKYGRPIGRGMQRDPHVCQRSNMQRMAHIISIYYC